jgi:hypothetical protein
MRNRATRSYEYNALCDVCGFKKKASELRKRWDGFMVCKEDFEHRHPMDFYTTRNDAHLLPWTRPNNDGVDVGPNSDSVNWALDTNGGTASASSTYGAPFLTSKTNDGNVIGGPGAYWNDNTNAIFPDWLQVTFSQVRPVNRVILYSLQDDYTNSIVPYDGMLGSLYVIRDWEVQVYTNSNWVTVATIWNNSAIKREVSFGTVYTDRIRVVISKSADNVWCRVVELEAYGTLGGVETTAVAGRAISGVAISGRE